MDSSGRGYKVDRGSWPSRRWTSLVLRQPNPRWLGTNTTHVSPSHPPWTRLDSTHESSCGYASSPRRPHATERDRVSRRMVMRVKVRPRQWRPGCRETSSYISRVDTILGVRVSFHRLFGSRIPVRCIFPQIFLGAEISDPQKKLSSVNNTNRHSAGPEKE